MKLFTFKKISISLRDVSLLTSDGQVMFDNGVQTKINPEDAKEIIRFLLEDPSRKQPEDNRSKV